MSQEDDRRALLEFLGVRRPARRTFDARGAESRASQPAELDLATLGELRARLESDPETVLANAPAWLGPSPTIDDVRRMLLEAERAIERPGETLEALRVLHRGQDFEFPVEHQFPGYHPKIRIEPDAHKFETVADSLAWAATAAAALAFRLANRKPDLPTPAGDAVYPLVGGGNATVALFSDWGTGYYHSQYIARHILGLGAQQAIHLGDVYYTGRASEFEEQVRPLLDPLLDAMPVYMLNANHEMDTHGLAYLEYLKFKFERGRQQGHPQPQETSVFCLRNEHYQFVALDTAYGKNGRFVGPDLPAWMLAWADARLREGRENGLTTILLTQNEPYGPGRFGKVAAKRTTDLAEDLASHLAENRIQAWFWGDEHYAALYEPAPTLPFFGSCIGHGGYPFYTQEDDSRPEEDVAKLLWCEQSSRFPDGLTRRDDVGRNGFCLVKLAPETAEFQYFDWMRGKRQVAVFARAETGALVLQSLDQA